MDSPDFNHNTFLLLLFVLFLLLLLSVYLSIWLSVCLPACQSVFLSVCLSVCLSSCLLVCLSVCLSVKLFVCCRLVCRSVYLSISLYVCFFACLDVREHAHSPAIDYPSHFRLYLRHEREEVWRTTLHWMTSGWPLGHVDRHHLTLPPCRPRPLPLLCQVGFCIPLCITVEQESIWASSALLLRSFSSLLQHRHTPLTLKFNSFMFSVSLLSVSVIVVK